MCGPMRAVWWFMTTSAHGVLHEGEVQHLALHLRAARFGTQRLVLLRMFASWPDHSFQRQFFILLNIALMICKIVNSIFNDIQSILGGPDAKKYLQEGESLLAELTNPDEKKLVKLAINSIKSSRN